MKIAYITAGAAGMFCGSCMRDNTLVAELVRQGHDALLIPTYTPIRTDEDDVSQKRVFFGGINVYLQQKLSFFRRTPWLLDKLLDFPSLLRWVSRYAVKTQADELGELVLSMLRGEDGNQRKEVEKLAAWLKHDLKPDIINLTNVLLSGMVPRLRSALPGTPILGSLQGDDIFLEALPAKHREEAIALLKKNCEQLDGFIATSRYYADFMAEYLSIPRGKIDVVLPGLNLKGHHPAPAAPPDRPYTVGYFARICPEKGFHILVEAFIELRRRTAMTAKLKVSGWLGENNRPYFDALKERLRGAGLLADFEHVESPDHAGKVRFLHSIDVLSVPTVYREPKGLYVLEAWANGVPVVQPRHGSFPELIEATSGGLLVHPEDPADLADKLLRLMQRSDERRRHAEQGRDAVWRRFDAATMARNTVDVYRKFVAT